MAPRYCRSSPSLLAPPPIWMRAATRAGRCTLNPLTPPEMCLEVAAPSDLRQTLDEVGGSVQRLIEDSGQAVPGSRVSHQLRPLELPDRLAQDRKSTRLNSSHMSISY